MNSTASACKNNVTELEETYYKLFSRQLFKFPEDNLLFVRYIANLFRYPYGISYSCSEASAGVFTFITKKSDQDMQRTRLVENED